MSSQKKDILIIEDSLAVSTLLVDFLKKIGYQNIHTCDNGEAGVKVFEDLAKSGNAPVVLLDYTLPDMNGDEVMDEILRIRPDAKVIIESASEKADESIKSILRSGAYEYLEKPIRFENLKNTMSILEEEDKILTTNAPANLLHDEGKQIDSLLHDSTRISLARIAEYTNMKSEDVLTHLKELQSDGKVAFIGNIKEISCEQCNSLKIGQTFHCPSCTSSNFKHGKLIEHYKCGNFSEESSYQNNICPKCRKEIKILGVDYRVMENYYICNDCSNKFQEPAHEYLCLRCNNKFKLDQAKWITSKSFRAVDL